MTKLVLLAGSALAIASGPAIAKDHHNRSHSWSYNVSHCPPGLAKKHNGCMPPGMAKRHYKNGQRYATNYGYRWNYSQIPYDLRQHYRLDSSDRYYYRDGYLYQVDPKTMLIEQVLSAFTRPY